MGPLGAMAPQLTDQAPLGRTEGLTKDLIPSIVHQGQQAGNILLNHAADVCCVFLSIRLCLSKTTCWSVTTPAPPIQYRMITALPQ